MAKKFIPRESWQGRHKSFDQKIEGMYSLGAHPLTVEGYKKGTKDFQELIAEAVKTKKTLRAMGSSWSLSKVGVTNHRLISSKNLGLSLAPEGDYVDPKYKGKPDKLRFFECGYTIGEINNELRKEGLSLKASGSNNGQSLPGVISTNTHGSAYKFGSTQEMVVGIHLITGAKSHVYLERKSYPVVTKKFTDALGVKLERNDKWFDAALVSFGSFGIIQGLMIETRDLFLLHLSRKFRPFNKAVEKAITKLNFDGFKGYFKEMEDAAAKRNGFRAPFTPKTLYHFQVTLSPNQAKPGKRPDKAALFFGFAGPYDAGYERPPKDKQTMGPGASGLEMVGNLLPLTPGPLKKFVKAQLNKAIDKLFQYEYTGIFQELFRGEVTQGKVFASGIGLPPTRALNVLDIALRTYEEMDVVMPVLITLRFVRGTKALLGFTKYKPTCVIELDGINSQDMQDYVSLVWERVDQEGIPFTMHWGKFNSFNNFALNSARVKNMYGANRDRWIESREDLLKPEARKVFTNDFLRRVGLVT